MKYSVLYLLILLGCSEFNKEKNKPVLGKKHDYDIKINYHDYSNRRVFENMNALASKDSIYLFIEDGFEQDLITIEVNKNQFYEEILTTMIGLGFAEVVTLGSKSTIKSIGIQLNKGKMVYMDIQNIDYHLFNLNYKDSTLILSVLKNAPLYD